MALAFADLIQSPQFTFFIGQEGKPIVVQAAAIAATSEHLDALINGGMGESEKRCARIEDVRVDDFIRFCEYAYRGDYTVPPLKELPPSAFKVYLQSLDSEGSPGLSASPQAPEELPPESTSSSSKNQQNREDDGWDSWRSTNIDKKKKGKKPEPPPIPKESPVYDETVIEYDPAEIEPSPVPQYEARPISRTLLRTQFNSRKYIIDSDPKALILQHFEPKSNSAVDQNFTPVLLAHARLYCFAHLRLIAPLKALTLEKLHKTLLNFKLYAKRIGDIIELARYAYSNPDLPDRSDDGTLDDLRKLVVEYIVCEIDTIGKYDEFVKYTEEGGEFVGDFWRMARDYMA